MSLIRKIFLFVPPILTLLFLFNLLTVSASASLDLGDKSGNGNDLTNHGATEWTSDFPFSGSTEAVHLTAASSQYLSANSSASLSPTSAVTLESWVKFDSTPTPGNSYSIMAKWDDQGGNSQRSYILLLFNSGGTLSLFGAYSPDGSYHSGDSATVAWTPTTGTWYHVAEVIDTSAKTIKYYVNGTQQGSTVSTSDSSIYQSTAKLTIGTYADSAPLAFLDGKIDDVRVWNVARTATQINNDKDEELTGTQGGLIAYYPFETPVSQFDQGDKSGNGNDLTNYGADEWTTDTPITGSNEAVQLSAASSEYLTADNSTSLSPTSAVTLESWVKFDSTPTAGNSYGIVGKWNDQSVNQRSYLLLLFNNGGTLSLFGAYSPDGSYYDADHGLVSWTPTTGTWYHVAEVIDTSAKTIKFYVNGTQQGSTVSTSDSSIYQSTAKLTIGAYADTAPLAFFDGKIDDVRVWNVARTATQISGDYNRELSGTETGLVAYYPFEKLLQNKITYYTANDGTNFSRATSPFSTGVSTQSANSDGSVTMSVNNTSGYADSGFVLYEGTLGNLPDFTINGTGDQYSANIWLDTGNNNQFFAWSSNVLTGLDSDTYALGSGSTSGVDAVSGSTSFYLMSDGQNHTLSDLKSGSVSGISSSTKVAIWIGVNTSSGSISSTINSISGL
jgi:hypothetical protein